MDASGTHLPVGSRAAGRRTVCCMVDDGMLYVACCICHGCSTMEVSSGQVACCVLAAVILRPTAFGSRAAGRHTRTTFCTSSTAFSRTSTQSRECKLLPPTRAHPTSHARTCTPARAHAHVHARTCTRARSHAHARTCTPDLARPPFLRLRTVNCAAHMVRPPPTEPGVAQRC